MTGSPKPERTAATAEECDSNSPSGPIWLEVLAVLAIGVIPSLSNAILLWQFPHKSPYAYWADELDLMVLNASTSFAVLYLICRSGEGWTTFGLARPRLTDFPVGLVGFFLSVLCWRIELLFAATARVNYPDLFPMPRSKMDYALMVPSLAASAFREELIFRAYLITRLERLLKSPTRAVILAALVFACCHIYYGIDGLIGPMLNGLLYGVLFLVMRRIWPFVVGHALFNIFVNALTVHS